MARVARQRIARAAMYAALLALLTTVLVAPVLADLYDVLEVKKDATDDDIKSAYKKAALKWCAPRAL